MLTGAPPAAAQRASECAAIESDAERLACYDCAGVRADDERLACYDRVLRRSDPILRAPERSAREAAAPTPAAPAQAAPPPAAAEAPRATPPASANRAPAPAPAPAAVAPRTEPQQVEVHSSRARNDDDEAEAEPFQILVVATRKLQGNTRFTADDGTVWIQTDGRTANFPPLPFTAEIRPGWMGSTFLVPAQSKRAIRVRRAN